MIEVRRMFQYNIVLEMNINSQHEFAQVPPVSFDATEVKEVIVAQCYTQTEHQMQTSNAVSVF